MLIAAVCAAPVLLAPGWRATLEPTSHDALLATMRSADPEGVFGVSRRGRQRGEEWHAQYAGGGLPRLLRALGVRGALPALVPPRYAAHVPAGAERADGYFSVRATAHWPWWRPGGGVDWHDPRGGGARVEPEDR